MLISKALPALRILRNTKPNQITQFTRNHGSCNYRKGAPAPSKTILYAAEYVQGFAWWWILWHVWTEPEHLIGEFPYPDPSKWTDEELGIQ